MKPPPITMIELVIIRTDERGKKHHANAIVRPPGHAQFGDTPAPLRALNEPLLDKIGRAALEANQAIEQG
jgi:hypothetical protein